MSFIAKLQSRDKSEPLKHPVSPGFSPSQWKEAYDELQDGSHRDRNAYQFGLFIFERLQNIRSTLQQIDRQSKLLPSDYVLNEAAKHSVNVWRQASAQTEERLSKAATITTEEIHTLRHSLAPGAGGYTQSEMIESAVDALRFVVRAAMARETYGSEHPEEPIFSNDEATFALIQTAHLYSMYERIWEGVLWSEAQVEWQSSRNYRVTEHDSEIAKEAAIYVLRRGLRHVREVKALESLPLAPETHVESFVSVNPKTNVLSVSKLHEFPYHLQQALLVFARQTNCAIDPDAAIILEKGRLPKSGVRIRDALNIRMRLAALAVQLDFFSLAAEDSSDVGHHADSIRFGREALAETLSKCLRLPSEYTQRALDAFVFDGSDRHQDLWARPLVPTANGLALISPSVLSGDPMRLIAAWARNDKKLEALHAERGHGFARHVKEALQVAIRRKQVPGNIAVFGPNLKIPTSDIDCLLIYENAAFVLECRTIPHTATPYEHWSAAHELGIKKTAQSIGQRDFLQKDPEKLKNLIGKDVGVTPIDKIVAVVVSNSHMYEGARDVEPYFVHVDTLMHAIIYGGPLFGILDGGLERTLRANTFKDGKPSVESFIRSIARPAKAEFYRKELRLISNPLQALDQNEPMGIYEGWACEMPSMDAFKNNLNNYSFFKDLELLDQPLPYQ